MIFLYLFGNINNTEKIYAISDLTINTSIKEGIALTSYESLAMGVPVVSSDVGGQKELINDEVGVVVPCIQEEKEILEFNYTDEEIINYVFAIQKIINNLKYYKSNCRKHILEHFTLDSMIKNMEEEFTKLAQNTKKEKNGKELANNIDTLKELITIYLISCKPEYEWLCNDFNEKNIHRLILKNRALKKKQFYEHTLEYKLKHPVVVALRKIGVYENAKRMLGME